MKLRFSLRTLFALVTAISIPMAWFAYHLNWARKREAFALKHHCGQAMAFRQSNTPWPLELLGAHQADYLTNVPKQHVEEARELFPESIINPTQEDYQREQRRRTANAPPAKPASGQRPAILPLGTPTTENSN